MNETLYHKKCKRNTLHFLSIESPTFDFIVTTFFQKPKNYFDLINTAENFLKSLKRQKYFSRNEIKASDLFLFYSFLGLDL